MTAELPAFSPRPRPGGQDLIEHWLAYQGAPGKQDAIGKGAPSYRVFWASWLRFLQARTAEDGQVRPAIPWYDATAEDMARFLKSGIRNRKPNTSVSDISRRRYWRLLDRIYGYALTQQWVATNPALDVLDNDKPPSEVHKGSTLTPAVWKAALASIPSEDEEDLVPTRNRAMLLVLFHLGITPQELRSLKVQDILRATQPHTLARGHITGLQLDGPGPNQRRRLQTPSVVSDAIARWLIVRSTMESARQHNVLFCSTHNPEMTPDNLLHLCKQLLVQAAKAAGQDLPPRLGPQIIRNTRLVLWLNEGMPGHEVVLRAGLKNLKGLRHLFDEINPEVRTTLAHGRDDEPPQLTQARAQLVARASGGS